MAQCLRWSPDGLQHSIDLAAVGMQVFNLTIHSAIPMGKEQANPY